jgi:molybdenum cofactor cytidylyltransferase
MSVVEDRVMTASVSGGCLEADVRARRRPVSAEREGPVAGIVLAAGASTRMGRNKLLLALEGESLLGRVMQQATAAGLDPIIVVLGHEADRALGELSGYRCQPVVNPDYVQGINTSLRTGIAALPAEATAVVVMLADMPFVTASMVVTLVQRYRESGALLAISDYAGVMAPPMLYGRSLFPELLALEGDGCGKQVARRHRSEAVVVSWPAAALTDLDVPADYEQMRARLAVG